MTNILTMIWMICVGAFCLIGLVFIGRDIYRLSNIKTDDQRLAEAIESGEIDNLSEDR